jgi:hypothetical protein
VVEKAPLLLLVFNRPRLTEQLLEALEPAGDRRIYVSCDGARPGVPSELDAVLEVRRLVSDVAQGSSGRLRLLPSNAGCGQAVSSALDWFFDIEEFGIVLEDDCIPRSESWDFFDQMLDRYQSVPQVGHIGARNIVPKERWTGQNSDYRYSRIAHVWGWATWRRAWKGYRLRAHPAPEFDLSSLNRWSRSYWRWAFGAAFSGRIDTWDFQWIAHLWSQGLLAITPRSTVVDNVGLVEGGAHAKAGAQAPAAYKLSHFSPPFLPPDEVAPDARADEWEMWHAFEGRPVPALRRAVRNVWSP